VEQDRLVRRRDFTKATVGHTRNVVAPTSLAGQFEQPYGPMAADFVHDSRAALHEDLWPDARAIGDGLGRAARMGGEDEVDRLLREVAGRAAATWITCTAVADALRRRSPGNTAAAGTGRRSSVTSAHPRR
jgi:hypothetical protein